MTRRPRLGAGRIRPEPAPTVNRTLETAVNQPDPMPAPGQVWLSRYTTGMHVAVTETTGSRVRIIPVLVSSDGATPAPGRGRWSTTGQLHSAFQITDHLLRSTQ